MSEPVKKGDLSGSFEPVVPWMAEHEAREIHDLLERAPTWLSMPAHLKPAFGVWRNRDLARYIRLGSLPIWTLNLVLTILGYNHYRDAFQDGDAQVWLWGATGVIVTLTLGVILARVPGIERHFAWLATPGATILLAKFVAIQQVLVSPELVVEERFFCVLMVFTVAVALRLSLAQAIGTLVSGGALGMLAVVVYAPWAVDWRSAGYYYLVSCFFSVFMAWQLEEKEKVSFLQSVLIARGARNQEQLNLELSRLAHLDGLSGLANRREFDRRLTTEWERMRREQRPLGLLFIDIDNFKAYNDHYGHAAGDDCLVKIGRAIRSALLRPGDLASRYGGEEFVVILPDTDSTGALDVARRVLAAVDALAIPHSESPTAPHATVSIGVAAKLPVGSDRAETLVEAADHAMYAAKHAGRHTIYSE